MNVTYLNGNKVDNRNLISLFNPSFLYGINCFEGIRGYYSNLKNQVIIFDLQEHIDRLYKSSLLLEFKNPIENSLLVNYINEIVELEDIKENIYIRVTFFLSGEYSWSETENISYLINIRSMQSDLLNSNSLKLGISNYKRISSNIMPPSVKAGANYLNSRYALLDAKKRGFEGALFLTTENIVSESTGSCVFFVKDNIFYTPSVDSDILIGITRNRILKLINQMGFKSIEKKITLDDLKHYEAAFLAGTMIEIKQISRIENLNYEINNSLTLQLISKFKNYIYGLEL
jgi:branched-chain amino acid aminotransferase